MLEQVSVKGFRSLRDFSLEIRPGLNVLVGPNGAGKTNIILFFDFFRNFAIGSLSDAVGHAGGVAQIFSKKGKNSFADKMQGAVSGRVTIEKNIYAYKYEFEIQFSASRQEVFFLRQNFLIERIKRRDQGAEPYLHVIYDQEREKGKVKLNKLPEGKMSRWAKEEFERIAATDIYAQHCIFNFVAHFDEACRSVADDFSGRFVLNVVPSHVKRPEDSTRKSGIDSDGSGLSATLYAIKKRRPFFDRGAFRFSRSAPEGIMPQWDSVIDLIRIAVPSITDIDVENDPFDNLLRCRITVGSGVKKAVLPLGAMSDGTVKWISLVVRLLTSRDALLLEEPENYLHPLMQREIVRLLRDGVASAGFMIVSTHSETLLNAVRPGELVLVSYTSGGTVAKRVANSKNIADEINRTGFGLGYYYLADAVEAE